jgi:hypothetical protein
MEKHFEATSRFIRWQLAARLILIPYWLTKKETGRSPIWRQEFSVSLIRALMPADGRNFH